MMVIEWVNFELVSTTKKYGGQFHFDVIGLTKRKILANGWFWWTTSYSRF